MSKKMKYVIASISIFIISLFIFYYYFNIKYTNYQVSEIDKWRLEDIYQTDEDWQHDLDNLRKDIEKIKEYKDHLSDDYQTFENFFLLDDQVCRTLTKVVKYAKLKNLSDKSNEEYLHMKHDAFYLSSSYKEAISFLKSEIVNIDENILSNYLLKGNSNAVIKSYEKYITDLINNKEKILTFDENRILSLTDQLENTPKNMYDTLIYQAKIDLDEPENLELYAQSLINQIKMNIFQAKSRNYTSALDLALDDLDMSINDFDESIAIVHSNFDLLHKWIDLNTSFKKASLELDKDIVSYRIDKNKNSKIEYLEGNELLKNALLPLGSNYVEDMKRVFENRWIDVYPSKNKQIGGLTTNLYDVHPYILLNYDDSIKSVLTLSHEMGHALNLYYSNKEQPFSKSHLYDITSEVPSVVNEVITLNYLIENAETKSQKLNALERYISLINNKIYMCTLLTEFEQRIHHLVNTGQYVDANYFNNLYNDLNIMYLGRPALKNKIAWIYVPQLYSNFYNYKYVKGLSAAVYLGENISKGDTELTDKYLTFLASGTSKEPAELLKNMDLDINSSSTLKSVMDKYSQMIEEYEILLNED